jgi:hypothetical protein
MANNYLSDRLEKLLSPPDALMPEDLRDVVARLYENEDHSAKATLYQLYLLLSVWLVSVAIAYGLVSEGDVHSFKLASVRSILIAVPAVIGLQYYLIAASLSSNLLITSALYRIYEQRLPKLCDLSFLLESPSFVNIENFVGELAESEKKPLIKLNNIGFYLMASILLFGGIAIFLHVISLALWHSGLAHRWAILASVIGVIPIARGFVLILTTSYIKG